MNTQSRKESPNQIFDRTQLNSHENFDFDAWARAVKRQMIEALSKKGLIEPPDR